mmetsp:Transcript_14354/g.25245  ORF Transcript_14354/g.25245 Transcript_14354/m.25245 type:complete len:213 (+) Transcript_14354:49-687(+)
MQRAYCLDRTILLTLAKSYITDCWSGFMRHPFIHSPCLAETKYCVHPGMYELQLGHLMCTGGVLKDLNHLWLALFASILKGCHTINISRFNICSSTNEQMSGHLSPPSSRIMKRSIPVLVPCAQAQSPACIEVHYLKVVLADGKVQGCLAKKVLHAQESITRNIQESGRFSLGHNCCFIACKQWPTKGYVVRVSPANIGNAVLIKRGIMTGT